MSEDIMYPDSKLKPSESFEETNYIDGLRKNWCCLLEDALECPICFHVPLSNVVQCAKGHNFCENCRMSVSVCPVCQAPFNGTRNWCVEEIVTKLEEMKSLFLDPSSDLNKCYRVKKKSQGTQTEEEETPVKKDCIEAIIKNGLFKQDTKIISKRRMSQ